MGYMSRAWSTMNSSETARVLCQVPASRAPNGPAVLAAGRVGVVLGTLIKRQQPGGLAWLRGLHFDCHTLKGSKAAAGHRRTAISGRDYIIDGKDTPSSSEAAFSSSLTKVSIS